MKKLIYLIGLISSTVLSIGIIFKLLHMPAANLLFGIGYLTFFLLFVPLLASFKYKVVRAKVLSERLNIILGLTSSIILGLAGLFKMVHLQGADLLLMVGGIVFALGFLPFFFFTLYRKSIS